MGNWIYIPQSRWLSCDAVGNCMELFCWFIFCFSNILVSGANSLPPWFWFPFLRCDKEFHKGIWSWGSVLFWNQSIPMPKGIYILDESQHILLRRSKNPIRAGNFHNILLPISVHPRQLHENWISLTKPLSYFSKNFFSWNQFCFPGFNVFASSFNFFSP